MNTNGILKNIISFITQNVKDIVYWLSFKLPVFIVTTFVIQSCGKVSISFLVPKRFFRNLGRINGSMVIKGSRSSRPFVSFFDCLCNKKCFPSIRYDFSTILKRHIIVELFHPMRMRM